jgi:DNA-binding response OmpR family regulator
MTDKTVATANTKTPTPDLKTILIVEDDPVLMRMYTEKFTYDGFRVVNARDGEDALKVATSEPVNAVLMDIMLPRMSGTDFLEKYRETSQGKDIPVIALTNLTEDAEKQKAIKLGVKAYLVKAAQTPEDVVQKIKAYL